MSHPMTPRRLLRTLTVPLIPLCLLPLLAHADIYKSVDSEGRVTYSNIPMKGARKLDLGPVPLTVPMRGHGKRAGESVAAPSPANFPKVDVATQHTRDEGRRGILTEEMTHEQSLLADARKLLTASPNDAKLKDNVTFHEKNIEALQKEMSRIK